MTHEMQAQPLQLLRYLQPFILGNMDHTTHADIAACLKLWQAGVIACAGWHFCINIQRRQSSNDSETRYHVVLQQ